MSHDVDTVIRHLLALTGADPRKAKLPAGKRKVRVHTQRIGDMRLITVAPMRGTLPEVDATTFNDVCASTDTVLLRGVVLAPPRTDTLWLALEGAGAVPLLPASGEAEATLRALVQQRVVIRGACVAQGIAVDAVQAVRED
jgi:hypothetical protein